MDLIDLLNTLIKKYNFCKRHLCPNKAIKDNLCYRHYNKCRMLNCITKKKVINGYCKIHRLMIKKLKNNNFES